MIRQYLPQTNEKCYNSEIQNFFTSKQGLTPRVAYVYASSACIQEISPLRRVRLLDFTCRVRVPTLFLGLHVRNFSPASCTYMLDFTCRVHLRHTSCLLRLHAGNFSPEYMNEPDACISNLHVVWIMINCSVTMFTLDIFSNGNIVFTWYIGSQHTVHI